jgi:hypothetical protein
MTVDLTEQEWVMIVNLMAFAPYREVQPFIQRISQQLMMQKTDHPQPTEREHGRVG